MHVKRLAGDALFISDQRWSENRFLAAGCKARCKLKAIRYCGMVGVLVVGDVMFIERMEAAFNV